MKKNLIKFVAELLVVVMSFSCTSVMSNLDSSCTGLFAKKAEASSVSAVTKVGKLQNFVTCTVIVQGDSSQGGEFVDSITIDSRKYENKSDISVDKAEKLKNKYVVYTAEDNVVTQIKELNSSLLSPSIFGDDNNSVEYKCKNGKQKFSLTGAIHNEISSSAYNGNERQAILDYYSEKNMNKMTNIYITLKSTDTNILVFKSDANEITFPLKRDINAGCCDTFECDAYIKRNYCPAGGVGSVKVECILNGYVNGEKIENVYSSFEVSLVVKNYDVKKKVEKYDTAGFLKLIESDIEYCDKLSSSEKLELETRFASAISACNLAKTDELFSEIEVVYDAAGSISGFGGNGVDAAAEYFLSGFISDVLAPKAQGLTDQAAQLVNDLFKNKYFQIYIKWYDAQHAQNNNSLSCTKIHCPTDIKVYDIDGEMAVEIKDNAVIFCEPYILVDINGDEKNIYFPSDDEYNIVITATADGTMDYSVEMYTPDGTLRKILYDNVPLTKGSFYDACIYADSLTSADSFNLISDAGDTVPYDVDTLPQVDDNVVNVVVAEELIEGLPEELVEEIADTVFNLRNSLVISGYQISEENIGVLFTALQKKYPVEFSVLSYNSLSFVAYSDADTGFIEKLRFSYGGNMTVEALKARINELKTKVNDIVSRTEGMDDFEKALFVHDYLVLTAKYDTELLDIIEQGQMTEEISRDRYSEYSILINGTGVCGSYALAYRMLMNECGVDCLYVSSSEMNHAWNMVKIGGNWYHVDCCWDDPVPDRPGGAIRNYFLRTDAEMMRLSHYSWTPSNYKATDSSFSSMPRGYDQTQKYDKNTDLWYMLNGGKLITSDRNGENKTEICSLGATSIATDNGDFYYSTGRNIFRYDLQTGKFDLVYRISKNDAGTNISRAGFVNFYIDGNSIEFYKKISDVNGKIITVYESDVITDEKYKSVTDIQLSENIVNIDIFKSMTLTATLAVEDGDADEIEIDWVSSDENIVSVEDGKIYAKNVGTAIVIAAVGGKSASCEVTVTGDGTSGTMNDTVIWKFTPENGTLDISGTGTVGNNISLIFVPWLQFGSRIKSIVINDGIEKIASYSFLNCKSVEKVTLPETLTSIGAKSFYGCANLTTVFIPKNVNEIGSYAFGYDEKLIEIKVDTANETLCDIDGVLVSKEGELLYYPDGRRLDEYTVPAEISFISRAAFDKLAPVKKITIPETVTQQVDPYTFSGCVYIVEFAVCEDNTTMTSYNGVLFDKTKSKLICYPAGKEGNFYRVPSETSTVCSYAFDRTKLKTLVIPENVDSIGAGGMSSSKLLFDESGLEELYILNADAAINVGSQKLSDKNKFVVYGIKDSTAESWAEERTYTFVAVEPDNHTHKYYLVENIEATEEADGYRRYVCWCNNAEYTEINHMLSETVIEPNCTYDGYIMRICVNCGYTEKADGAPKNGKHTYQIIETKQADCTHDGYDKYSCVYCGETYTEEVSSDYGHKMTEQIIPASCTENGYTKAICSECGITAIYNFVSPLGHKMNVVKVNGICTTHGGLIYSCERCNYTEIIADETENVESETVIIPATCTKTGVKKEVCKICGTTVNSEIIPAIGHSFSELYIVDTQPTCTEKGEKSRHCTVCDFRICKSSIDAIGHDYKKTETPATCTMNGIIVYTCSLCGHSYSEIINATGHKDDNNDGKCDNCETEMDTKSSKCTHMCHSKCKFVKFFWKIFNFFNRIFRIRQYCSCGAKHW